MPPSSPICVDASVVVRRLIEPDDAAVDRAWSEWDRERRRLVAPALLHYEVANALHRYRELGQRSGQTVQLALRSLFSLPFELFDDDALHQRAFELAERFNRPASYDAHYLAVAERLGIELWTTDQRLYNAVRPHLPWVNHASPEHPGSPAELVKRSGGRAWYDGSHPLPFRATPPFT